MGEPTPDMSYSEFLKQVYSSTSKEETQRLYDQWAAKYDKDLGESGYTSPLVAVEAIVKNLDRSSLTLGRLNGQLSVLDAGCGTGQVGAGLVAAKNGFNDLELRIDGVDLSRGMLDVARKTGTYRNLSEADLSRPLEFKEDSYDVVACVGTLTKGHVGAGVLREFVRVAKRGWGLVAVTVLDEIWEKGGYRAVVEDLNKLGRVEVRLNELFDVWAGDEKSGRMVLLRKKYLAEEIANAGIGA